MIRVNVFTVTLLLVYVLSSAGAQTTTSNPPDPSPADTDLDAAVAPPFKFTASVGLVAALILIAVFLLAVYSIFTVHVSRQAESNRGGGVRPRAASARRGLDPDVVGTFPTLVYADVKGLRLGKGALECVVCLTEFEDDEVLRLIPKCDHVFHPECIDEWLGFHTTCPVCRADLVPRPGESIVPTAVVVDLDPAPATVQDEDEDPIIDQEQGREPRVIFEDDKTTPTRNPSRRSGSTRPRKFSRSHSTGHSLVQPGEDTERFTLRLPVDIRKQVMSRAVSMAAGASSSRRGYRGEGSSRGKSICKPQLLDRPFRSERWGFTRLPSFLTRPSPVPSPRVLSGEGGCIGRLPSFLTRSSPVPSPRVPPNNQGGSTGRSNQLGEGPIEPSQLPV